MLVASGANFLVLDEPTNHLDLESREALEEALEAFPGTVLLVSHDRAVLDAVARRTLAIEDGAVARLRGGWADYARRGGRKSQSGARVQGRPGSGQRGQQGTPAVAKRPPAIVKLEAEIEAKELEVADLERWLARTGPTSTPPLPTATRATSSRR